MEHIGKPLDAVMRNIEIVGADAATRFGFTQVPNFVLTHEGISAGAKLAYAMLLHYAWQNDYCFPGQDRLAKDMGAGKRSVIRFMDELEKAGFIAVQRRGQGKTNLYQLFLQPTKKGKKTGAARQRGNPRSAKMALLEVPTYHH
jgi:hypothetical protein